MSKNTDNNPTINVADTIAKQAEERGLTGTVRGGALGGGGGALLGAIVGGPLGAALGAGVGGALGAWLGQQDDRGEDRDDG